jgi:succinyl-CoA synthetase alpha subunit
LDGIVDTGVGVSGATVTEGELGTYIPPLTGVECCTVLILISNDPSTPAIETITKIMSNTAMILAMWFFRDIS